MRVGVVTTSYPRFAGDAAGNFVEGHVLALRALGHDVDVVAAGDPRLARDVPAVATAMAPYEHAGRIVRVQDSSELFYRGGAPDRIERSLLGSLGGAASFTARLARAVSRCSRRWDSIVAHWLVPSAVVALVAHKPVLAIAHGGDVHTLRRFGLLGPTLRLLRSRDVRISFVSSALRELARAAVPDLVADVQPMGVDLERFGKLVPSPVRERPIIFVAARLVPIKGVDVAIEAFGKLATTARLVIAGDGPERTALQRRARHRDIEFVGDIPSDERDRWLAHASVVVVPSRVIGGRSEGTPTIAVEALAAGVPVIASAVGGLVDLPVELVPPDEPATLAAAIDRAVANPTAAVILRQRVSHLGWRDVAPRLVRNV